MISFWSLILTTTLAGVVGTGLGGVLGAIFGMKSEKTLSNVLSFASGIMLAVVCLDLIPESLEICLKVEKLGVLSSLAIVLSSLCVGIMMVMLTNTFVERAKNSDGIFALGGGSNENKGLFKAGWMVFFALAIHNLPEGMAIGSGGCISATKGYAIAILIALHDIPEGMSVSCPLIAGGMSKYKGVLMSVVSGLSTILGGVIGFMISGISPIFSAVCVMFAGGAMLYVTFSELLPQSIRLGTSKSTSVYAIIGIVVGLILTYILKI